MFDFEACVCERRLSTDCGNRVIERWQNALRAIERRAHASVGMKKGPTASAGADRIETWIVLMPRSSSSACPAG
jgi:hypothetical protein